MGNTQASEVDLLEVYLRDPAKRWILANCLNGTQDFNNSQNIDWENCVSNHVPMDINARPYFLPLKQQILWFLLFGVMIFVSVAGNTMVMWIILAHKRMRTVTNFFLLNLAVADFLLASVNAAFNFVFMLESHWPFGETLCTISNFVANLTVSTSVFTIFAMSIDRFVAIVRPLRRSMTKRCAYVIIMSVWLVGAIISCPSVIFSSTLTFHYANKDYRTICYLVWPDGPAGYSYYDHLYNVIFLVVTYLLPMVSMAFTYTWVGCILWGSKVIGENTELQNEVVRSKHRVVHMLIAIVVLFGICWLPYHAYFLYVYYNQEAVISEYIQHIYLAIYWLAMSNSCYNPIVYYWMNSRFRDYFKSVLCFPKRRLLMTCLMTQHMKSPKTATFTCSTRSRSCRIILPYSRATNRNIATRFTCSRL